MIRHTCCVLPVMAALLLLVGCSEPLPPLLDNASPSAGWISACPPRNEAERKLMEASERIAVSPELDQRLREQFPPETAAERLVDTLVAQGFILETPCAADPSIQHASFSGKERLFANYGVAAHIYWKTDDQQRILWTRGFMTYLGH